MDHELVSAGADKLELEASVTMSSATPPRKPQS